jgi:tRNA-2-methylthio-N6-dimethylallyladenosine synthase
VGFPGETEEEFEGTLACMKEFQFDGAFMFRYSPRPGTPAADMEQVPVQIGKDRLDRLIAVQNQITLARNESKVGTTFEVLVEGSSPKNPGQLQGYSRCFRMIHFPGDADRYRGELVQVQAERAHPWGLSAKLI